MPESILRLPEVKKRTGLARSTIYKLINDKSFPSQISLGGGRAVGWLESEVDEWIMARVQESRKVDVA